ncbi:MAG: Bug family tripartite tricarboxylate transporter substrate binding protein [Beijerinckiaceae bacterium]
MHWFTKRAGLIAFAFATLMSPSISSAQDFKGKQIRLLIGAPPGGGYDAYARLLAQHMGRHVSGQPAFVVQNMPGAASITLVNHLVSAAPKDGTAMGAVFNLVATNPLLFPAHAKYDARELNWVGSILRETYVGVVRGDAGVTSLADVLKREVVTAGSTGATNSFPSFANSILGTKFKVIVGYPGTRDGMLAVERKEVDALVGTTYASVQATAQDQLSSGAIRFFVQFGVQKHPEMPKVSWIFDFAQTPDQRAAMDLMFGAQEFGRPYVLPPGVPAPVVEAMRAAFDATMTDKVFLEDAARRKLDIEPVPGVDIAPLIAKLYQTPPHVIARVKEIVGDVP